jgi:hypothetical protein
VGVAVCAGSGGRPGKLLPWLGAVMAAFSILLGWALLIMDVLPRENAEVARRLAEFPFLLRLPLLVVLAVMSRDLLDWVFVAIGVWEGWSIPRRLNAAAEAAARAATSAIRGTAGPMAAPFREGNASAGRDDTPPAASGSRDGETTV